jgi:ATP-binding cassette, subfamily B, bacterial
VSVLRVWSLLRRYLRPLLAKVFALALLLFGGIGLQLVGPQLLRVFIDAALAGASARQLGVTAGLCLAVAFLAYLLAIGATAVGEEVGWAATTALRADLVAHCLELDLGFHHARTPGELVERVDGDVQALANLFSHLVLRVLGNLCLLFGVLGVLWFVEWWVGLAFTLLVCAGLATLVRSRAVGVAAWRTARETRSALIAFLEERVSGTIDSRANGATNYTLWRLGQAQRAQFVAEIQAWLQSALPRNLLGTHFAGATTLALGLGGWLALNGTASVGAVATISAYATTLFGPLSRIGREVEQFQESGASVARLDELLTTRSALRDGSDDLPDGALAVAFDAVTFGYDPDNPVLHDLSSRLAPGRTLGLLGRTGSGKTTFARLLLRLYDTKGGVVRLAGRDIRGVWQAALRRSIGIVTQDVQLFSASLRDNLTFFDPDIPDERILAVLDHLGLGEWCRALPHGLDTELPPGGGISAGEAQLLAFARVFLHDPGLVILDEASSRLDPATERRIALAVDWLPKPADSRRTAIVIAHRLATVERADDILILEDGRILEYGARECLAADPTSAFARLLRSDLGEVLA